MKSLLIKPRKGQKLIKWHEMSYHFITHLEIFSSDIEEINVPSDFPTDKLTSFQINCPNLRKIPSFLGSCQNLEILKIKNSPFLTFDKHDYDFFALKIIQLSNLELTEIPNWLEKSKAIETLDLNNNKIKSIPEFFKDLGMLRRINLDQNKLTRLPDFMAKLPKLNHLSVDDNEFSEDEKNRIFRIFKITL